MYQLVDELLMPNNKTCGISSTGWGEYFIRNVVAYDISSQIDYLKIDINQAAKNTLKKVKDLGGSGGVIGIDNNGNIMMNFNTKGMYRGYINSDGETKIEIYQLASNYFTNITPMSW